MRRRHLAALHLVFLLVIASGRMGRSIATTTVGTTRVVNDDTVVVRPNVDTDPDSGEWVKGAETNWDDDGGDEHDNDDDEGAWEDDEEVEDEDGGGVEKLNGYEDEEDEENWDNDEDGEEGEWGDEESGNDEDEEAEMSEEDRLIGYHERNYTWPLSHYVPNTPGWKLLMDERFRQVSRLQDAHARYEGYVQTINSAYMVPNFTEHGFGLARAPSDLMVELRQAIRDGLPTAGYEDHVHEIDAPLKPLFIHRSDLTERVLYELQSYAEEWSGMELSPFRAYGFRLYQNQSQLTMHVDRMQTHIISFILHIDSSEGAEPWPIFIEDLNGQTHEVILTPGDILFYESSKCFHGRPRRLNGSWYSSLFVHYYPRHGWQDIDHDMEAHFAVPPVWREEPNASDDTDAGDVMEMVGSGMRHPQCPNAWCPTKQSIKWSGPGEEGVWIAPNFERHPFHPKPARYYEEL